MTDNTVRPIFAKPEDGWSFVFSPEGEPLYCIRGQDRRELAAVIDPEPWHPLALTVLAMGAEIRALLATTEKMEAASRKTLEAAHKQVLESIIRPHLEGPHT